MEINQRIESIKRSFENGQPIFLKRRRCRFTAIRAFLWDNRHSLVHIIKIDENKVTLVPKPLIIAENSSETKPQSRSENYQSFQLFDSNQSSSKSIDHKKTSNHLTKAPEDPNGAANDEVIPTNHQVHWENATNSNAIELKHIHAIDAALNIPAIDIAADVVEQVPQSLDPIETKIVTEIAVPTPIELELPTLQAPPSVFNVQDNDELFKLSEFEAFLEQDLVI